MGGRWPITRWLLGLAILLALSWVVVAYFVPAPPSKITMATGPRGTGLDYFGRRYQEAFARAGIELDLRSSSGSAENFTLVHDPNSGVQIAILSSGLLGSTQAPELLSLGHIYVAPLWVFYPSSLSIDNLTQLKGKRIAVGPEGSGVRSVAEQILGRANINPATATLMPLAGRAAEEALNNDQVDAAFLLSNPDAPVIRALLKNPRFRLLDFSTAEALARIFPALLQRLTLPKGVIELDPLSPANDIALLGLTSKLVVRGDLHPAVVQLLAKIAKDEHEKPGIFQRTGEFPTLVDSEFPMSQVAVDYYRNGPSLFQEYLPFWMTIYGRRTIALLLATLAIALPVFGLAPKLYGWFIHEQLRRLYRRLRVVETALQAGPTVSQAEHLQNELAAIDRATRAVPMRNSDLYFMLKYHLDRMRARLTSQVALESEAEIARNHYPRSA